MYLRRLGFPIEVCDIIISKGALGGHLPTFSAVGRYSLDYSREVITNSPINITYDPIIDGYRNHEAEVGRMASFHRCLMELAYGDYYEEILEEKGIEYMRDDMCDRYTDSVSGEENKDIMREYIETVEILISTWVMLP